MLSDGSLPRIIGSWSLGKWRGLKSMLTDTHPEAEKVQIELLRQATVAERLQRAFSLTAMSVNLSRRAIAEANPQLTAEELEVEVHRVLLRPRTVGPGSPVLEG